MRKRDTRSGCVACETLAAGHKKRYASLLPAVDHAAVRSGPTRMDPDHDRKYYVLDTAGVIIQLLG